jgi:hypothetical protein
MKPLAFVSLLLAVAPAFADEGASTPTLSARGTQIYGEAMPLGRPLNIGEALAQSDDWRARPGKFEGRVTQVCQTKGCWLVLADGDRYARVFSGHGFFLPKDTTGRAIVHGRLSERTIPEAFAKHLAEDSGRDPATVVGDQVEFRIDASSVELLPAS